MAHDQLFKDLLQAFFREFMELFFPDVAERLDFTQVTFLMQEVFTDIPEGEQRKVDLVAEVMPLEGAPELILIHVEVEATRRSSFPFRMSEYYMLLRLRHRLPVLPIVVYLSPGTGGLTQETYTEAIFGRTVLRFVYEAIGLPDLEADAYREVENPLAPALSALMRPGPTGRLAQKLQALRLVLVSDVDDARKSLLVNVIETYLPLTAAEEAGLQAQIDLETRQEVEAMLTTWLMTWEEKVLARGKRDLILQQLRHKFGDLPEAVVMRLQSIESGEELDRISYRVLDAHSLAETGLPGNPEAS